MRENYGLEGVPLIIDFVPHSGAPRPIASLDPGLRPRPTYSVMTSFQPSPTPSRSPMASTSSRPSP